MKIFKKRILTWIAILSLILQPIIGVIPVFADTSSNSPTSVTGAGWTTPENAMVQDVSNNALSMSGTISPLTAKGYGFNIPAGATINGVEVSVYRKSANGTVTAARHIEDSGAYLVLNNTPSGTNKAVAAGFWYPAVPVIRTFGAPTDTWGLSLTPADINNANFGFQITPLRVDTAWAVIDYIGVKVYYTIPVVPIITINPYNTAPTNQDVIVTASTDVGSLNATSHTFTSNGSFDFIATNGAQITTQTVTITNIDKIAPTFSDLSFAGRVGTVTSNNVDINLADVTQSDLDSIGNITMSEDSDLQITFPVVGTFPTVSLSGGANPKTLLEMFGFPFAITPSDLYTTAAGFGGIIPVTGTLTDPAGNVTNITINISMQDITAPVISFPVNEVNPTLEATGPFTAFTFHPTVTDNDDPAPLLVSDTPIGSQFPIGSTIVTWTATDTAGNTSTATQTVTVMDTTGPQFDPFSNITAEATSSAGAVVTFTPTATDITGTPTVTCDPASGSTFALGTRIVTCTAEDSSHNISTMTFSVYVQDTTPPEISNVDDAVIEATSSTGATATYTNPSAIDLVDGIVDVVCSPLSGSIFTLGVTTVTCSAMDNANNSSGTSFTITVQDTTAPELTMLGDNPQTVEYGTPYVDPKVTFSDAVDGTFLIRGFSRGVNTNLLGTYTVNYIGEDDAGNSSQISRTVNVVPRSITITSDPQTKVYGTVDPALTYLITGGSLIGTDTFTGTLARLSGEDTGLYAINQGTLVLTANYDLSFIGSNLDITKAPITVTIDTQSKAYGTADPALTYTITSGRLSRY